MRTIGGGWNNYSLVPTVDLPNYRDMFTNVYPSTVLDPKFSYVLDRMTEFHCRAVEQAVISYIQPEINDLTVQVSFTFPKVDINTYVPTMSDGAHSIVAYNKNGSVYNTYYSIKDACRSLGISESVLNTARNRVDYFTHCPIPDIYIRLWDNAINCYLENSPLNSHQKLFSVSGMVLDHIPTGIIRVYLENKCDVYGDYPSCSAFASEHGINPWQTYRYLNLDRAIPIFGGSLVVYLCCNPETRRNMLDIQIKDTWPVVSTDSLDGTVRFHNTPASARLELSAIVGITELKPTRNFVKDYITGPTKKGVRSQPSRFRRRFQLVFLKDYNPS